MENGTAHAPQLSMGFRKHDKLRYFLDRKSVVKGKSVDLGDRGIIKKKIITHLDSALFTVHFSSVVENKRNLN